MKLVLLFAVACIALVSVSSAQTYTAGEKSMIINGEVVRYEPGHVIVVRGGNNQETTYTLSPKVNVPADVQVGRKVTLYTEQGADGTTLVSRVVSTSVTPEGNVKRTTEETRTQPSGATTTTTTTTISGKVETYVAGKTLTIQRSDGSRVTYVIDAHSRVPADLVIGKTVSIVPLTGSKEPVAQTITYTVVPE
jgi:hypothetical protein